MKNIVCKFAVFFGVMMVSWLLLSFYFFPIEANIAEYPTAYGFFLDAMRHIAAIKCIISLVFSVFALFVAELHAEKKKKQKSEFPSAAKESK